MEDPAIVKLSSNRRWRSRNSQFFSTTNTVRDGASVEIPKTGIRYRLDLSGTKSRQLGVGMTVDLPSDEPLDLVMPRLSPGSPVKSIGHDERIQDFHVLDAKGQELPFAKQDDGSFRVARQAPGPVIVQYTVEANEFSHVRNSVNDGFGYISGAAAMMYVKGHESDMPSTVELTNLPQSDWKSISTLAQMKDYPHGYWANSYQDIADSNIFVGDLKTASAKVGNTNLVVNVQGEAPWDGLKVNGATAQETLQDLTQAYEVFTKNFGEFSLERVKDASPRPAGVESEDKYVLNKHYVRNGSGYSGGFEHYHGHELILDEKSGPTISSKFESDGRVFERGILTHELVHKMLAKYVIHAGIDSEDLSKIGQTDGLWVTEGVTDWTASVLERQAGQLSFDQYGQVLEGFYNRYQQNMAERPTSPTEDSRQAHQGNSNYYNKGAVAASLLDLEIRHSSNNQRGMFDVIRDLKDEFGGTGRGHTLDDMERLTLQQVKGNPEGEARIQDFYDRHLRDRQPMDIDRSLSYVGFQMDTVGKTTQPFQVKGPGGRVLNVESDWGLSTSTAMSESPVKKKAVLAPLGLTVTSTNEGFELTRVKENGPAGRAGLYEFQGNTAKDLSFDEKRGLFSVTVSVPDPATGTSLDKVFDFAPEKPVEYKLVASENATGAQLALRQAWQKGLLLG